jgi:hypothetical protein
VPQLPALGERTAIQAIDGPTARTLAIVDAPPSSLTIVGVEDGTPVWLAASAPGQGMARWGKGSRVITSTGRGVTWTSGPAGLFWLGRSEESALTLTHTSLRRARFESEASARRVIADWLPIDGDLYCDGTSVYVLSGAVTELWSAPVDGGEATKLGPMLGRFSRLVAIQDGRVYWASRWAENDWRLGAMRIAALPELLRQ